MTTLLQLGVIYKDLLSSLSFSSAINLLPNPDITIIVIVFLQYHYNGDSFKTIPRYNEAILPVSWYIAISGFHCTSQLHHHSYTKVYLAITF